MGTFEGEDFRWSGLAVRNQCGFRTTEFGGACLFEGGAGSWTTEAMRKPRDFDLLGPELEEIKGLDFDLALTGFDHSEIDPLLVDPDADERANAVPEVPDKPVSVTGDLWSCGPHRTLCGDSTSQRR